MEDMNTEPLISVVTPIYNQSHLIRNAMMSIVNQTFKEWEMIIVDDGSDASNRIDLDRAVKQFADKRIRVIEQNHLGLVVARNTGNYAARGEYIAIQDADDLSMPDRLEKCFKVLEKGHDVVAHGAYINMWDGDKQCVSRMYLPPIAKDCFNVKASLKKGQPITGWPVFKKTLWERLPFRMETQYAYDWAMWVDWIYSGASFMSIPEGLYEYVRQSDSASIRFEREGKRAESAAKIQQIIKDYESKS